MRKKNAIIVKEGSNQDGIPSQFVFIAVDIFSIKDARKTTTLSAQNVTMNMRRLVRKYFLKINKIIITLLN
jgi:hypothetical protein